MKLTRIFFLFFDCIVLLIGISTTPVMAQNYCKDLFVDSGEKWIRDNIGSFHYKIGLRENVLKGRCDFGIYLYISYYTKDNLRLIGQALAKEYRMYSTINIAFYTSKNQCLRETYKRKRGFWDLSEEDERKLEERFTKDPPNTEPLYASYRKSTQREWLDFEIPDCKVSCRQLIKYKDDGKVLIK